MASPKRIYLILIIFGILGALLVVFLVVPIFREISRTSQDFFLEKNKMAYFKEERSNIQKIENIYKTYQPDLDKIESLFFDPEVPVGFVGFLEKTAIDSQIKLEISSLAKKTEKEELWPSLSLQLLTTGSFNNFLKFLEKIENSFYLIEITDLNVRKLTDKEISAAKLANIPEPDAATILTIRVFTQ